MAAHRANRVALAGHQTNVDTAFIIAVNHHDVPKRRAPDRRQDLAIEGRDDRAAFRLDDTEHIRLKVHHHACGIAHGVLIDRLVPQFQGADPIGTTVRDDLKAARLGPLEQATPIAAEDDERASVGFLHPQRDDELGDLLLVGIAVGDLPEQAVQRGKALQHGPPFSPGVEVHRFCAIEEVFDIVDGKAHAIPPTLGTMIAVFHFKDTTVQGCREIGEFHPHRRKRLIVFVPTSAKQVAISLATRELRVFPGEHATT